MKSSRSSAVEVNIMPSPFPGMDPFIESCELWGDFHASLVAEMHRTLAEVVPDKYFVRTDERSYMTLVDISEAKRHVFVPDVKVRAKSNGPENGRSVSQRRKGGMAVLEEPLRMNFELEDERREKFIEIYEHSPEQRLVTSIEVLSPTNKRKGTEGWEVYQRKRRGVLLSQANLVEIDLLRGGERMPMANEWPKCPYTFLVAYGTGNFADVWRGYYKKRLPVFPIPLAHPDPDIPMDLQPMIEAIYKRSRYDLSIDYTKSIKPSLSKADREWLKRRLRKAK